MVVATPFFPPQLPTRTFLRASASRFIIILPNSIVCSQGALYVMINYNRFNQTNNIVEVARKRDNVHWQKSHLQMYNRQKSPFQFLIHYRFPCFNTTVCAEQEESKRKLSSAGQLQVELDEGKDASRPLSVKCADSRKIRRVKPACTSLIHSTAGPGRNWVVN